jgi:hypothetical protein
MSNAAQIGQKQIGQTCLQFRRDRTPASRPRGRKVPGLPRFQTCFQLLRGRFGDVEVSHREAVDLDLAQARFADFKPADGERPDSKRAYGERPQCERTHRDGRHACRRPGDRLEVKARVGKRLAGTGVTAEPARAPRRKASGRTVTSVTGLPLSTPS